MTTKQATTEKDLVTKKLEAEVNEAEARIRMLRAQAEIRAAKADMDEISGLTATKERVKKNIADMRRQAADDYAATKREVEEELQELHAGIKRFNERFAAWDAAAERHLNAKLDEAEAKLDAWKARLDQKRAERAMKRHDELATLEESIALARARAAEAKHEKYNAKSQAALEDAARHFDEVYAAAAKRYET